MKTYEERMQSVQHKLKRKQSQRKTMMVTAGALCLCILVSVVFPYFQNRDDLDQYSDSEYFKVIEAINRNFPKRDENNWFEGIFKDDVLVNGGMDMAVPEASDRLESPGAVDTNASVEITDHQVAGVLEADIIKRSQTHIFYLNGNTLEVYPISGADTKLLNTWRLNVQEDCYYYKTEMYLSADANRINLITSGFGTVFQEDKKSAFIQVVSLDVTDPTNIQQANCLYITGSLLSSRMVGDQMLIIAQYRMASDIDFEDESTFLPQYGVPENMQSIPADNIVVPEKLTDKTYTVVTLLDGKDMTILDSGAFMSYSTQLYVSKEGIYATRTYTDTREVTQGISESKTMTEISCMGYSADGLECKGTFCVEGSVKNQYSMDEHDGIFRIVTATNRRETTTYENGYTAESAPIKRNANLTCFKVGTWEQVAQVEQFAPDGETVESVRFDGDYAYVCTAVVVTLTDPVFFFDMSDLNNIKVKDTGTIDGYSSSLIQLNDGYLMGVGFDDQRNLKVEIYEETEAGVTSVCDIIYNLDFASEYKAYYIDRENNLFGIPVQDGYVLLHFDGYQLHQVAKAVFIGSLNETRGVVIEEYLYVFSQNYFDVKKIG